MSNVKLRNIKFKKSYITSFIINEFNHSLNLFEAFCYFEHYHFNSLTNILTKVGLKSKWSKLSEEVILVPFVNNKTFLNKEVICSKDQLVYVTFDFSSNQYYIAIEVYSKKEGVYSFISRSCFTIPITFTPKFSIFKINNTPSIYLIPPGVVKKKMKLIHIPSIEEVCKNKRQCQYLKEFLCPSLK